MVFRLGKTGVPLSKVSNYCFTCSLKTHIFYLFLSVFLIAVNSSLRAEKYKVWKQEISETKAV